MITSVISSDHSDSPFLPMRSDHAPAIGESTVSSRLPTISAVNDCPNGSFSCLTAKVGR